MADIHDGPQFTFSHGLSALRCFDTHKSEYQHGKVIDDEEKTLLPTVLAGLKLLELDSLGGSGSRGYGKIALEGLTIDGQDRQAEFAKLDPFKTQTK